ncbi:hypothetical protein HMPREF1326_03278 [Akkermansia sp. KLE1605]|nr:hypothetical protein HMPREF1326_03278 [Akkermansia sp. KLE1605]
MAIPLLFRHFIYLEGHLHAIRQTIPPLLRLSLLPIFFMTITASFGITSAIADEFMMLADKKSSRG